MNYLTAEMNAASKREQILLSHAFVVQTKHSEKLHSIETKIDNLSERLEISHSMLYDKLNKGFNAMQQSLEPTTARQLITSSA